MSALTSIVVGFSLLLIAMRSISEKIDQKFAKKIAPWMSTLAENKRNPLAIGFLGTILFQASSICVITSMGFASRGLISLEQGMLLSLGASLGSTLKGLFFSSLGLTFGTALLGLPAVFLFAYNRHWAKALLELLQGVGLTFLGLKLLEQGLSSYASSNHFSEIVLNYFHDESAWSILGSIGCGCIGAVMLQSSSALYLLTLELLNKGLIPIPVGAAIILGANVGTTSTALIASLHLPSEGRRLAWSHFLMKASSCLIALVFFRFGLEFITVEAHYLRVHISPAQYGVLFHVTFNLFHLCVWSFLCPALANLLKKAISDENSSLSPLSHPDVQSLAVLDFGRGLESCLKETSRGIRQLHDASEGLFSILLEAKNHKERIFALNQVNTTLRAFEGTLLNCRQVIAKLIRKQSLCDERKHKLHDLMSLLSSLEHVSRTFINFSLKLDIDFIDQDKELVTQILSELTGLRSISMNLWEALYKQTLCGDVRKQSRYFDLDFKKDDPLLAVEILGRLTHTTQVLKSLTDVENSSMRHYRMESTPVIAAASSEASTGATL